MKASEAAVLGAQKTADIVARMGRAGTVGERADTRMGVCARVIFTELAKAMK